jgi:hypothetical protein
MVLRTSPADQRLHSGVRGLRTHPGAEAVGSAEVLSDTVAAREVRLGSPDDGWSRRSQ